MSTPLIRRVHRSALPEHDAWLSPAERRLLAMLHVPARRSDWRLGRWAARAALSSCPPRWLEGAPATALSVLPTPLGERRGAPRVIHDGRTLTCGISLSHRAGWALCSLAPPGTRVGCDLEQIEPRSPAFIADFLTPGERSLLPTAAGDTDECANLVWSAKESAVKLLGTGWRVPARTVEVVEVGGRLPRPRAPWPDHPGPSSATRCIADARERPATWARLEVDTPIGRLRGGWRRQGAQVMTWLAHRPDSADSAHSASSIRSSDPADWTAPADSTDSTDSTAWAVRDVPVGPSATRCGADQSGSGSASAAWAAASLAIGTRKGEHDT